MNRLTKKLDGRNVAFVSDSISLDVGLTCDENDTTQFYYKGDMVDRLAVYEDAEEQGRLIMMPEGWNQDDCVVYIVGVHNCEDSGECPRMDEECECDNECPPEVFAVDLETHGAIILMDKGVTIHATREDAEAELARRTGGTHETDT